MILQLLYFFRNIFSGCQIAPIFTYKNSNNISEVQDDTLIEAFLKLFELWSKSENDKTSKVLQITKNIHTSLSRD